MSASPEADLQALAGSVVEASTADETEVILTRRDGALTRFANSEIHQNVSEQDLEMRIRVVVDGRVGVASTNQLGRESLVSALAQATASAASQPRNPDRPPMPRPSRVDGPASTAGTGGPDARAERVREICALAEEAGVRAFGALSESANTYAIANSHGLYLEATRPFSQLVTVAMGGGGSGYSARAAHTLAGLDTLAAGREAVAKAGAAAAGAEPIEPGVYPVVLQEHAVAEALEYLVEIGMSGLALEEGRTFMRPGEKVTGDLINLWDDGNDPAGIPMPFDFEGVPRKRVDLIEAGVVTGLVHDLASAARAGVESTGHGLPAPNPYGAWPANLFMGGGDAVDAEALTAGIERGVWVTRFWYVNPVDPRHSVLTGMSREGTFLIEDGKISRPIKDMRFTQSMMDAFATCTGLTRETMLLTGTDYDYISSIRVPALRLEEFNFTSVTR